MNAEAVIGAVRGSAPPKTVEFQGEFAPASPRTLDDVGVSREFLADLLLKNVYLTPNFTTAWAAEECRLSLSITGEILQSLKHDHLVEIVGQDGPMSYRWAPTEKARQLASRLLTMCGYTGPAPVSLDAYAGFITWQCSHLPEVKQAHVDEALATVVLPARTREIVGLAARSRRSLFLYGPPGNGKTLIGHLIHKCFRGHVWVPYGVLAGGNVIKIFDPHVHVKADNPEPSDTQGQVDHRWVRVDRPFVVTAAELTLEDLTLAHAPMTNCYEAPLHVKANGGIFLLDDLGYQQVNPYKLLSRWVYPMEHQVDFLQLTTGQKIYVPFLQQLVVSTNLDPDAVMEPAILRRIGYRVFMGNPHVEHYAAIFHRLAEQYCVEVPDGLIDHLVDRHRDEDRPLRCCEPRDLFARIRDVCSYRGTPFELNEELVDTAWTGYFGNPQSNERWNSWG